MFRVCKCPHVAALSLQLGYSTVPEWICKTAGGNVWEIRIVSLPSCVYWTEMNRMWNRDKDATDYTAGIKSQSCLSNFHISHAMPLLLFEIVLHRLVLDLEISTVCPTVPTVCHVSVCKCPHVAFIATWIFNSPRVNLQDSWRQCVGNTYCFVTILRILNRNEQNVKQRQKCGRLDSRYWKSQSCQSNFHISHAVPLLLFWTFLPSACFRSRDIYSMS